MAWSAKEVTIFSAAGVAQVTGLARLARHLTRSKIPILTYHSVSTPEDGVPSSLDLTRMRVTPREFRKQMEYVARHYNAVSLEAVHKSRSDESTLPPHPCVITFDDGYLDVYENAVPMLEEFGLKATFFVIGRPTASRELPWLHAIHEILDTAPPTLCVSAIRKVAPDLFSAGGVTKNDLCQRVQHYFFARDRSARRTFLNAVRTELGCETKRVYRFMEDHHIKDLHNRGFEIGCHSMDHEYMTRLSDDELRADIHECKEVLSGLLNGAPSLFCYPFGHFDARVIEALKREGFTCACTTNSGLNDRLTNPFALNRIGVYSRTNFPVFVFRLVGLETELRNVYRIFKSPRAGKGTD